MILCEKNTLMKKSYLIILLMVCTTITNAQITITADGNTNIAFDTFSYPANIATTQNLSDAKTNATWDLSTMVYDAIAKIKQRKKVVSTTFSNASYSSDSYYPFAGGLSYDVAIHKVASSSGIVAIGEVVVTEQRLSLTALTGNANDNLTFPMQDISYSGESIELAYPFTIGNHWSSTSERSTDFKITIAAYGLNNTPGIRKTTVVLKDTVIGWGTVKVKNFYTTDIHIHEVLQVKVLRESTDSFFINGSPAPKSLLDAFGLKQGQVTNSARIQFYKKREIFPLIEVWFQNGDMNSDPDLITVHQSKQSEYALGTNPNEFRNTTLYPNPLVGDKIYLKNTSFQPGIYQFSIVSMGGQLIESGEFTGQNVSTLTLNSHLPKGVYFLKVTQFDATIFNTKLIK